MKFLPTILFLFLVFSSCHKHEELITPEDYYEYGDINKLFNYNLEDIKVIEPFDAEKGLTYALNNKAEINIPSGCLLTIKNEKASGEAELSFIEIYDRGTMAITNKPTSSEQKEFLSTAGMYYITAAQNKMDLKPSCAYTLRTPITLTSKLNSSWHLYTGSIQNNNNLLWETIDKQSQNLFITTSDYIFSFSEFGIKSLNTIIYPNAEMANLNFEKPASLNINNSQIFIALEGFPNVLGYSNALTPLGVKAHYILVVANEKSDGFFYAIKKSQTPIDKQQIKFTKEELKEATSQELKEIVNALP